MSSTSILVKLSSQLSEAEPILEGLMKQPSKKPETFRDYLRRVMAEEGITDLQIDEATKKAGFRVSKSWVNLILTNPEGVNNAGIRTLNALADALHRSREEVIAAFMEEPLRERSQLLANLEAGFKKLSDADAEHYTRVLEDVVRSMRRSIR